MFKPAEKSELRQVSLTGMRAIVLLGLLTQAPRNLAEIREKLVELNILEEEHSDDIIRIDLNTLRYVGCDITKATRKTDYKYVLRKSPYSIDFSSEEINILKKVYKKIKDNSNIDSLLKYHNLFVTLANCVSNDETKEELYGISVLKSFNSQLIEELLEACNSNLTIKFNYKNPTSKEVAERVVLAQKIVLKNDKIYLYGYDKGKNRSTTFNIQRILAILSKFKGDSDVTLSTTNVRFILKDMNLVQLEESEKIVETKVGGYLIEGHYFNDFVGIQRILSFGANCTVIEPDEFRNKIIEKLKSMREVYNDSSF